MEELIKVTVKNDQQLVSARDLYKGLEINRRFSLWVKDNFKSFIEHEDFEGVRKSIPYNAKARGCSSLRFGMMSISQKGAGHDATRNGDRYGGRL